MSTYTLEELLKQWINEELTVDQAIGHILQHLITIQQHQQQIERCLSTAAAGIPVVEPSPPPGTTRRKP